MTRSWTLPSMLPVIESVMVDMVLPYCHVMMYVAVFFVALLMG